MNLLNRGLLIATLAAFILSGCVDIRPYRTNVLPGEQSPCPQTQSHPNQTTEDECAHTTPEIVKDSYELHFVEFDDQGWLYPDRPKSNEYPSHQIANVIDRLHHLLDVEKADLSIIVYVHGWKHDAQSGDSNIEIFRGILQSVGAHESRQPESTAPRKVVGIYVAWRGATWPGKSTGEVMDLSFWGRKAAAERIAQGSPRELFARLHAIQRHYNGEGRSIDSKNPAVSSGGESLAQARSNPRPRIRTLMLGHSFGAAILYAATSGPLIEVLSREGSDPSERLADMIVLINPAMEAARYEPLFEVASRYHVSHYEPPLLVTISTCEDQANRLLFPIGRIVTSVFERPTSSNLQSWDLHHTYGHVDRYITHRLYGHVPSVNRSVADKGSDNTCPLWQPVTDLTIKSSSTCPDPFEKLSRSEQTASAFKQSSAFYNGALDKRTKQLPGEWGRVFCGGLYLKVLNHPHEQPEAIDNSNAIVWNVETDGEVMRNHSDLNGNEKLISFIEQLYGDVALPVLAPSGDSHQSEPMSSAPGP
ncbi:hypothetical protein [Paraburkholderia sp.]|uniref:hypothetical protein n=1 Tax=Paraburkholderia sp. TaxID=1926495 RepID=UPI003C7D2DE7